MKQVKAHTDDCIAFVLIVFLTFILTFSLQAQVSSLERQALIDLYNSTNGDNWKNTLEGNQPWLINDPNSLVSDWYGVSITNGRVSKLSFFKNNLTGTLPNSIGDLQGITQLVLSSNDIGGVIPVSLGQMINLRSLHLSGNEFSGEMPIATLINAQNLTHLYFDSNNFSGSISPQIGQLKNLLFINMGYNDLTGTIPIELGQLTKLSSLYLTKNKLTGTIPQELGQLVNLSVISLSGNQLTGVIPLSLTSLSNLGSLSLNANQLSGSIPPEIGQLSKLYSLGLNDNNLTGTLPPELGGLSNMKRLYVHGNQITGSIPASFGQLTKLDNLTLGNNQLSGSIPSEIGQLTNLKRLYIADNQLTGSIPSELGQLSNLEHAHLHNNRLTGSIPLSFDQLINLKVLYVYGNDLKGKIPQGISTLTKLYSFGISGNKFVFSDFESEFSVYKENLSSFAYKKQQDADNEESINVSVGDSITLTSNLFTSANNNYQWYKGDAPISGATNKEYVITNASETDAGIYKLLVGNSIITGLDIYRNDITLSISSEDNACAVSAIEKQALVDLYNSTDGANWTNNINWATDTPVCNWAGVTVENGKVTKLSLVNNGLKGTIPTSFGNLVNLTFVNLAVNQLSGTLPSGLSELATSNVLNSLSISSNNFVFSDFESDFTTYKNNLTTFTYLIQEKVDQEETQSVASGQSITLSSTVLTSTNNNYQWYKDGVAITGATNKDLVISNAADSDAGVYHFTVTNTVVTDLILTRNSITLDVTSGGNELEFTVNTKDLPNSEYDIVTENITIPSLQSGNADSETLVNLGADTGENKTVLINVKPSQKAAALQLRLLVNSNSISNVQVSNGTDWLDFSPEFYRIEGKTIYFRNKKVVPTVPFTMNLINGVQYDSPVPLTINVNSNIDLTGATLEIFTPSNANLIVSPSTTINGFIVPANLVEPGSYKFVIKIQNKSFKGHFLVVQSGEVDEGGGGNAEF